MLKEENKELNRRIELLEENQRAMTKQIKDLNNDVTAKIKKP
jgi:hypothetical protein